MKKMTMREIRDALLGKRITYCQYWGEHRRLQFVIRSLYNQGFYVALFSNADMTGSTMSISKNDIPQLLKKGVSVNMGAHQRIPAEAITLEPIN